MNSTPNAVASNWFQDFGAALSLKPGTPYVFAVEACLTHSASPSLFCDGIDEQTAIYPRAAATTGKSRIVFLTSESYTGDLLSQAQSKAADAGVTLTNGIEAADYLCSRDPISITHSLSSVKALLMDYRSRPLRALETDWVLVRSARYTLADGTYFGTTDVLGAFSELSGGSQAEKVYWTGTSIWNSYYPSMFDCDHWSSDGDSGSNSDFGRAGMFLNRGNLLDQLVQSGPQRKCSSQFPLLCIEQDSL